MRQHDSFESIYYSKLNSSFNGDIVYLTAESETELSEFDPRAVYVLGALVDHNRLKSICHNKAQKLNVKTARLPISKYVNSANTVRTVITLNQCAQICFSYWQNLYLRQKHNMTTEALHGNARKSVENSDFDQFWQQILLEHLPKRSVWTANNTDKNNMSNNSNSNENSIDGTKMS